MSSNVFVHVLKILRFTVTEEQVVAYCVDLTLSIITTNRKVLFFVRFPWITEKRGEKNKTQMLLPFSVPWCALLCSSD